MGVPVLNILLGFVAGWYSARRNLIFENNRGKVLKKTLFYGLYSSLFTFATMLVIWGPPAKMLADPGSDFKNFGIPMILYDPVFSFIGWLVLMIVISPLLQFMASVFSSYMVFTFHYSRDKMKS